MQNINNNNIYNNFFQNDHVNPLNIIEEDNSVAKDFKSALLQGNTVSTLPEGFSTARATQCYDRAVEEISKEKSALLPKFNFLLGRLDPSAEVKKLPIELIHYILQIDPNSDFSNFKIEHLPFILQMEKREIPGFSEFCSQHMTALVRAKLAANDIKEVYVPRAVRIGITALQQALGNHPNRAFHAHQQNPLGNRVNHVVGNLNFR